MHWEYKTITLDTHGILGGVVDQKELERLLNEAGKDGWEAISSFDTNKGHGATRSIVVLMKRPVSSSLSE